MVKWLRLLGILLLAYLLAFKVDLRELGRLARHANPWLLLAAVAVNVPILWIKSERWRVLLRAQGLRYRPAAALRAFTASQYVGIVTPGRVGDLTRVAYLRRDLGVPLATGATSVIADRLCDLYFLLAVGLLACARFSVGLSAAGIAATIAAALLPATLWIPGVLDRILRFPLVLRLLARLERAAGTPPPDPVRSARDLSAAARALLSWRLVPALGLTVCGYLGTFVQWRLLAGALGLHVGFVDISLMAVAANLVALLPISISGIGTRDATLKFLFPRVGQAATAGVALGLAVLLAAWVVMAVAGFVAFELWPPPAREAYGDSREQRAAGGSLGPALPDRRQSGLGRAPPR